MKTASLTVLRPVRAPTVRAATLADVPQLETLIAPYVATGDLLPRSNYDLCRHIKEYVVAETPGGAIVGCGSLKVYSQALGEIAGLAVHPDAQGTRCGPRHHGNPYRRGAGQRALRVARPHPEAGVLPEARIPAVGEGALPTQGVGRLRPLSAAELL